VEAFWKTENPLTMGDLFQPILIKKFSKLQNTFLVTVRRNKLGV
jgi:hypothetical protein